MEREGEIAFNVDGAFYNPKMKLNRDISVAVVRALGISEYLDALSASGVRGIRVAKETGAEKVVLNDVSKTACSLIEENVTLNSLDNCEVCCSNANVLLHKRRFEAVDLDPFGSPAPFLAAGSRSASSYLFATATDTAPLCGAHLKSGIRKYMAVPVKTEYHREMGARILLGTAARELARVDKAMVPLLTFAANHYVRIFLRIIRGAKFADKSLNNMGYVEHCPHCGSWRTRFGLTCPSREACENCAGKIVVAGPLWLGPIQDPDLISKALVELESVPGKSDREVRLLKFCRDEIELPMYRDHHCICKSLGTTPGPIDELVEKLKADGWKASRTHFSGVGIKTDAPLEVLRDFLIGA